MIIPKYKTNPELPSHDIVGLVQFTDRKDFYEKSAEFVAKYNKDKTIFPFEFDQIQMVGTVNDEEILQIRFVKFLVEPK